MALRGSRLGTVAQVRMRGRVVRGLREPEEPLRLDRRTTVLGAALRPRSVGFHALGVNSPVRQRRWSAAVFGWEIRSVVGLLIRNSSLLRALRAIVFVLPMQYSAFPLAQGQDETEARASAEVDSFPRSDWDANAVDAWQKIAHRLQMPGVFSGGEAAALAGDLDLLIPLVSAHDPKRAARLLLDYAYRCSRGTDRELAGLRIAEAERILEAVPDSATGAYLLVVRAISHHERGMLEEAESDFRAAIDACDRLSLPAESLAAYEAYVGFLMRRLRYVEACAVGDRAVAAARNRGRPAEIERMMIIRARALMWADDPRATDAAREAYDACHERGNLLGAIEAKYVEACGLAGPRDDEALERFAELERLAEQVEGNSYAAAAYQERGLIYLRQNRFDAAFEAFEEGYQRYQALPDGSARFDFPLAENSRNRAFLLAMSGRIEGSIRTFGEAIERARRSDFPKCEVMSLRDRGFAYRALGQADRAREDFASAIETARRYRMTQEEGYLEWGLALASCDLGRFEEAEDHLAKAAEIGERLLAADPTAAIFRSVPKAAIAWVRGRIRLGQGRPREAMEELGKAAAMLDVVGEFLDLPYLVHVPISQGEAALALGDPRLALGHFEQATDILDEYVAKEIARLGEYSTEGVRVYCAGILDGALEAIHSLGDSATPADVARAYAIVQSFQGFGFAAVLAERGNVGALRLPEALRSELVAVGDEIRKLTGRRASLINSSAPTLTEKLRIGAEIARITARLPAAERERDDLVARARALNRSAISVAYPLPATLGEVQGVLGDEVVLEFAYSERALSCFVIARDSARVVSLGPPEPMKRALSGLQELVKLPNRAAAEDLVVSILRDLSRRLVTPILAELPSGVSHLRICPGGPLARVPFDALLLDAEANAEDSRRLPFLVTRYTIDYVHSGTVLRDQVLASQEADPTRQRSGALILGDPKIGTEIDVANLARSDDLGREFRAGGRPLRFARDEALMVAAVFATSEEASSLPPSGSLGDGRVIEGSAFRCAIGAAATESWLENSLSDRRYSVIHLACHGESDPAIPSLSRIFLAPDETNDGWLHLAEIRDLNLDCDLLVLSACETGTGPLSAFDGVTGFARAGLVAGARAVIGTLWTVEDRHAAELFTRFYGGGASVSQPARALRDAKLAAIEARVPILTWSGFVLWSTAE